MQREHQSKHWQELGVTLLGIYARIHASQLKPEFFGGEQEKEQVLMFFEDMKIPPILLVPHCYHQQ
jgi:hypothetical protein